MKQISLGDLTVRACYCEHEQWKGKPHNGDTARSIDAAIKICPRALGGLNIGCAHYYMQPIKGVDFLLYTALSGHAAQKRFRQEYDHFHRLKLYIDQLTRMDQGIKLEDLDDPAYIDDPRYATEVFMLSEDDPLRLLFGQIEDIRNTASIGYLQLLHRAEDILMERINTWLDGVRIMLK